MDHHESKKFPQKDGFVVYKRATILSVPPAKIIQRIGATLLLGELFAGLTIERG